MRLSVRSWPFDSCRRRGSQSAAFGFPIWPPDLRSGCRQLLARTLRSAVSLLRGVRRGGRRVVGVRGQRLGELLDCFGGRHPARPESQSGQTLAPSAGTAHAVLHPAPDRAKVDALAGPAGQPNVGEGWASQLRGRWTWLRSPSITSESNSHWQLERGHKQRKANDTVLAGVYCFERSELRLLL
jgi:hypothetical protein